MKKFIALLLALTVILLLAACELPKPDNIPTQPSSSVPGSSVPDASTPSSSSQVTSIPNTSIPDTAPSIPPTVPSTTPTTVPATTPTAPLPTTPTTGPAPKPEPEPEPDYRQKFMEAHNAGQKYSFTIELDTYEISLNSTTGFCTVWHREKVHGESYFNMGPIGYQTDKSLNHYRNYYYMGTYKPDATGNFKLHFDSYYLDVDLSSFSASIIKDIRKYAWDNLQNQWKDYYLTQAECEMWDSLLDGNAEKDIRRWIYTMEISGSASLPLQLTYYYSGDASHSIALTDTQILHTEYLSEDSYSEYAYDLNGKSLYSYTSYGNGAYQRTEYDDQERICHSINQSSDGSYIEQTTAYTADIYTVSTYYYVVDKVDGLYCRERIISVYRYNPDNPSMDIPVSSHHYDRNNHLVKYHLYTEKGLPLEVLSQDPFGNSMLTLYTYENDRLVKTVATDSENTVTTTEYVYDGSQLSVLLVTRKYANGDIEQWEEPAPAAPAPAPN